VFEAVEVVEVEMRFRFCFRSVVGRVVCCRCIGLKPRRLLDERRRKLVGVAGVVSVGLELALVILDCQRILPRLQQDKV